MRGRKPIPTELKRQKGTYRRDRANGDEPTGQPCLPPCPDHLQGEARATWNREGKGLADMRVLTAGDRAALAMFCTLWARHVEAESKIAELGAVVRGATGGAVVSPWVHISAKAIEQAMKIAVELGLTPSARARIKIVPQAGPRTSATEFFEEFFERVDRN